MERNDKLRLALLISGSGTTAEAVIKVYQQKRLTGIWPVVVISSRPDAPGIQKAEKLAVKTIVVRRKDFPNQEEFGKALLTIFEEYKIDLVSQNGWLPLTPANVVKKYQGRIINQHPGPLDPGRRFDFGGEGMYGARVTCARLAYEWVVGEKRPWTESIIHYVNEEYDSGDLIRVVPMKIPSFEQPVTIFDLKQNLQHLIDTTKDVQVQLLPLEHENVIEVLANFTRGNPPRLRRSKPLIPSGKRRVLFETKKLAIKLFPKG